MKVHQVTFFYSDRPQDKVLEVLRTIKAVKDWSAFVEPPDIRTFALFAKAEITAAELFYTLHELFPTQLMSVVEFGPGSAAWLPEGMRNSFLMHSQKVNY